MEFLAIDNNGSGAMQKIKNQLLVLVAIVLISGVAGAEAEDVRLSKEGGVYHLPVRINDAIELLFIVYWSHFGFRLTKVL